MCGNATESTIHVMCACPKIAQSLYKARHDRLLRPICHCLLEKYNFQQSENEKPWYQQRPPSAVMENENAKIIWNVPFQPQKAPENGANNIDMAVYDKKTNKWTLLNTLSAKLAHFSINIANKKAKKQEKYTEICAGIKTFYKSTSVRQINMFFTFSEATMRS